MSAPLTPRSQFVLRLAYQEAQRLHHPLISTAHLLIALLKEGNGVAAHALQNAGLELRQLRNEAEMILGTGDECLPVGLLPGSPRVKQVMTLTAADCARELNHSWIGTEHLLLGLLREGQGSACQILVNLGIRLDGLRQETLALLGVGEPVREKLAFDEKKLVALLERAVWVLSCVADESEDEDEAAFINHMSIRKKARQVVNDIVAAWQEAKVKNRHVPNVLGTNVGTLTPALSFPADDAPGGNPYSDLPLAAQEQSATYRSLLPERVQQQPRPNLNDTWETFEGRAWQCDNLTGNVFIWCPKVEPPVAHLIPPQDVMWVEEVQGYGFPHPANENLFLSWVPKEEVIAIPERMKPRQPQSTQDGDSDVQALAEAAEPEKKIHFREWL